MKTSIIAQLAGKVKGRMGNPEPDKQTKDEEVIEDLKTDRDDSLGYSHDQSDVASDEAPAEKAEPKAKKEIAKKKPKK